MMTANKAQKRLEKCIEEIKESGMERAKPDKIGMNRNNMLSPSTADWKMIKFYERINKDIKQKFRSGLAMELGEASELSRTGPRGTGTKNGKKWDLLLRYYMERVGSKAVSVNKKSEGEKKDKRAADAVLKKLREKFRDLKMLDFEVPLYGFMKLKSPNDHVSEVYLWRGRADAVAWYDGDYVIVDWKVVELLNYWEESKAFGAHLHQCIVYARLLQLHLQLDYLPPILIVPIDGVGGNLIHPGLFTDYPQKTKDKLNEFSWSKEMPGHTLQEEEEEEEEEED